MDRPDKQPIKSNPPQPLKRIPAEQRVSATRCPYCHDDAGPEDDAVACRACLARHHEACWEESGSCGSCGGEQALRPQAVTTQTTQPSAELNPRIRGLLIVFGVALLLLLGVAEFRRPPGGINEARPWETIGFVVVFCLSLIGWGAWGKHP